MKRLLLIVAAFLPVMGLLAAEAGTNAGRYNPSGWKRNA